MATVSNPPIKNSQCFPALVAIGIPTKSFSHRRCFQPVHWPFPCGMHDVTPVSVHLRPIRTTNRPHCVFQTHWGYSGPLSLYATVTGTRPTEQPFPKQEWGISERYTRPGMLSAVPYCRCTLPNSRPPEEYRFVTPETRICWKEYPALNPLLYPGRHLIYRLSGPKMRDFCGR